MSLESFEKFSTILFLIIALVFFYQSWMNLVKKRLTKFSMDALVLWYLRVFRGKEAVDKANKLFSEEPSRMRTIGILALCSAFTAIYVALEHYLKIFK